MCTLHQLYIKKDMWWHIWKIFLFKKLKKFVDMRPVQSKTIFAHFLQKENNLLAHFSDFIVIYLLVNDNATFHIVYNIFVVRFLGIFFILQNAQHIYVRNLSELVLWKDESYKYYKVIKFMSNNYDHALVQLNVF